MRTPIMKSPLSPPNTITADDTMEIMELLNQIHQTHHGTPAHGGSNLYSPRNPAFQGPPKRPLLCGPGTQPVTVLEEPGRYL